MLQQIAPIKPVKSKSTNLPDCQKEQDYRRVKIDKVGIRGLRYPIRVSNKAFQAQNTIATFSLTVELPEHLKGTHMSRFVEALNANGLVIYGQNVVTLARDLQVRLEAETAHIEIEFPYFVEKKAPVTGTAGLVDYNVKLIVSAEGRKVTTTTIVTIPVTTLCPCSKAISKYGAHNQRGYVTVTARGEKTIWVDDLISMVEASASSEIFSVLKREDEKAVTERAYEHPGFVEDLVRNVALYLNARPDIAYYKVEAENMESIHNHAAYACVEKEKQQRRQLSEV